jgi:superfamily I DNA and RNA helicase
MARAGQIGGMAFSPAGADAEGKVVFDSVRRFKGMDRPVVLIIDVDKLVDAELTYVALTRPPLLLKVFGSAAALARLRAGPGTE